ncbi:MAG TPA: phosphatase PAP2 family protein [Firmicutes bacterium]|nr:phosphatase PAP2 family protein [Bacillota bacterium]
MQAFINWVYNADWAILNFIEEHMHSGVCDAIFKNITHLGDGGILWIIVAIALMLFRRTRYIGIAVAVSLALNSIICLGILKPAFARLRPFMLDSSIDLILHAPTDFSFPSGHTASSFSAAVTLLLYNRKYGVLSLIAAALIAFSRLYLMVHFPSDVIAGIALGALTGAAAFIVTQKLEAFILSRSKKRGADGEERRKI